MRGFYREMRKLPGGEDDWWCLKGLGQFFGKSAVRTLWPILIRGPLVSPPPALPAHSRRRSARGPRWPRTLGFWRLRLIGAQQPVFQRRAIKSPDDEVHFFRVRSVDEGESLRFLRLRVANHFHVVVYEVFCVQPGLNIVLGYPDRQVSEEDRKAHSEGVVSSVRGFDRQLAPENNW